MNRAKISLAIAVVLAAVCPLHAGLIIDIQESGADVVVTTSGTLNTTGLTSSLGLFLPSGNGGLADFGAAPNSSRGLVTRGALVTLLGDPSFSGPAYPFLETNKLFNSSSGDATGLGFTQNFGGQLGVYIPSGYVSETLLSALGTWDSTVYADLGVSDGDTFTWTWGSGPNADFVTINVGNVLAAPPVPEPSSVAIWSLLGAALCAAGWRRARCLKQRATAA